MTKPPNPPSYEDCLEEAKANMRIEGFDPQISQETVENHVPNITRRSLEKRKADLIARDTQEKS